MRNGYAAVCQYRRDYMLIALILQGKSYAFVMQCQCFYFLIESLSDANGLQNAKKQGKYGHGVKKYPKNLVVTKKSSTFAPHLRNETHRSTHNAPGCSAVGSVPGLGPGCRRFESCHPDKAQRKHREFFRCFFFLRRRCPY